MAGAAIRLDAAPSLATKNIELFGREVLPHPQKIWEDKLFENTWWPKRLRNRAARQREMAIAESLALLYRNAWM